MVILTSVYYAKLEPVKDSNTGKIVEPSVADLKDAERKLTSVYQGTNRVHPIDHNG